MVMGENIYRLLAPHRAVLSIYNSQVRRVICGNHLLQGHYFLTTYKWLNWFYWWRAHRL